MKPTPPLTTPTDTAQAATPDISVSDAPGSDNPRLSHLESTIGEALAFRVFKSTARYMKHPVENDGDLEALNAAAAACFGPGPLEEYDPEFASPCLQSWDNLTAKLSEGKLNWWKEADSAPVVDLPVTDEGGYFADERRDPFDEGGI